MLQCVAVCGGSVLQRVAVWCSALQWRRSKFALGMHLRKPGVSRGFKVCCSVWQCVAVRYSGVSVRFSGVAGRCRALQGVAVRCKALQYVAVMLQCIAVRCSVMLFVAAWGTCRWEGGLKYGDGRRMKNNFV
jgi:hypothetical protein